MCFLIFFSTTSDEDFSLNPSEHFKICSPDPELDAEILKLLAYPYRWNLASKFGGCSCNYRHEINGRGFGPVEDWYHEDPEDVDSTKQFYDLLQLILSEGHQVDLLDVLEDTPNEEVSSIEVELGKVPRDHFRFLENIRMQLRP